MSSDIKKRSISPLLEKQVNVFEEEFDLIPEGRRNTLEKLSQYVKQKLQADQPANLIFICTHNSRRSHISQIWAQTAAHYYDIPNVLAYSGGTEATAFNPRAVKAMKDTGFIIQKKSDDVNPVYEVAFASDASLNVFSKKYDDKTNPATNFGAVMTCSHADENCPFIPGADVRIPIPYDDPKDFDETPHEAEKYAERVHQIGREIFYAFSLIKM